MESYSVVQSLEHLMGQPLHCSPAPCWHVGREAMVMVPPPTHDSAVLPCFHGCPSFLHRHFQPQSPPSHPLNPSLCSQNSPRPGVVLQPLKSSSQPLCLPGDLHPCPGYIWLWQGLSDSHFIQAATDQLFHSQP